MLVHYRILSIPTQNWFLSSVATDDKNGHGFNLENVVPNCSSFNAVPVTITKKITLSNSSGEFCT